MSVRTMQVTDIWLADQWYDTEVRPTTDDEVRRLAEEDAAIERELTHYQEWD